MRHDNKPVQPCIYVPCVHEEVRGYEVNIRPRTKPRPGRLKGDDLTTLRGQAYERDNGHCVACGVLTDPYAPVEDDKSFHLAHRRGKRMWGDHIGQVEVQCGRCHRLEHAYGKERIKPCPPKSRNR